MRIKLAITTAFFFLFIFSGYSTEMSFASSPVHDSTQVKAAIAAFKSLPAKEKRYRLREARKSIKEFKAAKKAGSDPDVNTLLLVILALLLPPLAVYLHQGEANSKFWITTLLFVLGLIGAFAIGWYLILASVVYALIVILGNN
ncbi:MAG TPA: YqaE/Pmp3 family membrane protein [Chitinophagaceae bacterium]|nr:YqaE/Pmp3 family membrane protein [Chitinophagaceae bacterium]